MSKCSAGRDLRALLLLLASAIGCHDPAPILVPIADGAVVAPEARPERYAPRIAAAGAGRLLVPWTTARTDVAAIAEAARAAHLELIMGLTPARRASEAAASPEAPAAELDAALERALDAGDALTAMHLDHLELALPGPAFAAYLEATRARVASRTALPFGASIPAPPRLGAIERGAWAAAWGDVLAGRVDRVLVVVDDPADDFEHLQAELAELQRRLGPDVALWASVDARASVAETPRLGGAPIAPGRKRADLERAARVLRTDADAVLVAGAEAFEPDALFAPEPETRALPDDRPELETEAQAIAARLRRGFIREGQVLGRIDGTEEPDRGVNLRPAPTVDLTAYWAAASAFRFATTRDPQARIDAREAWRALHALAHATPARGEVARAFTRALDGAGGLAGTGTTARWTRSPDRALYFVAGASPAELAAWVLGAAAHHALSADDAERAEIALDFETVLDEILARGTTVIDARTPDPRCAELADAPLVRRAVFQVGATITRDERHEAERLRHSELPDLVACGASALADPDEPEPDPGTLAAVYLLFAFETDAGRRAALEPILDAATARRRPAGDALADVISAIFRPGLDGGRRAGSELERFDPSFLDNAGWLAAHLPLDPFAAIERRPGARLDFAHVPGRGARLEGGFEDRFSGVTFLLAYWMGRYHAVAAVLD